MSGPGEEIGKVSGHLIDALRSQPLALALIVINLLFLGAGIYVFQNITRQTAATEERRSEFLAILLKGQQSISEKLTNCR